MQKFNSLIYHRLKLKTINTLKFALNKRNNLHEKCINTKPSHHIEHLMPSLFISWSTLNQKL